MRATSPATDRFRPASSSREPQLPSAIPGFNHDAARPRPEAHRCTGVSSYVWAAATLDHVGVTTLAEHPTVCLK